MNIESKPNMEPITTTTNVVTSTLSSPAVGVSAGAGTVSAGLLYYIGVLTPYLAFVSLLMGILVMSIHLVLVIQRLWKNQGKKLDDIGE